MATGTNRTPPAVMSTATVAKTSGEADRKRREESGPFGKGSLATSGNSHALRIDKSFVRQNPILARTGSKVRFKKVASNTFVFVVLNDVDAEEQGDPVVEAYLSFLEDDMRLDPSRIATLSEPEASRLERLVEGIDTDEEIAPDVTF